MTTTFDFGDENGEVPAHRHINPDDSIGSWVADSASVEKTSTVEYHALVFEWAKLARSVPNFAIYIKPPSGSLDIRGL